MNPTPEKPAAPEGSLEPLHQGNLRPFDIAASTRRGPDTRGLKRQKIRRYGCPAHGGVVRLFRRGVQHIPTKGCHGRNRHLANGHYPIRTHSFAGADVSRTTLAIWQLSPLTHCLGLRGHRSAGRGVALSKLLRCVFQLICCRNRRAFDFRSRWYSRHVAFLSNRHSSSLQRKRQSLCLFCGLP